MKPKAIVTFFSLWFWFSLNHSVPVPTMYLFYMCCVPYVCQAAQCMVSVFFFFIPVAVLQSSNEAICSVSTVIRALSSLNVSKPNTDNTAEVFRWWQRAACWHFGIFWKNYLGQLIGNSITCVGCDSETLHRVKGYRLILNSFDSNVDLTPWALEVLWAGGISPLLSTVTVILALKLITRDLWEIAWLK